MITSITIKIFYKTVAFLIELSTVSNVFICTLSKIICINKITTSIVRGIYVPTDFDTKEKALSGEKAAEKGLK